MKRTFMHSVSLAFACAILIYASGIIPAIIPAAVPTANKIGNSAKFQLATGAPVAGNCAAYDASLNLIGQSCTTGTTGPTGPTGASGPTGPTGGGTFSCGPGLGDGLNAITAGTYLASTCFNGFGSTYTITSIRCFTDNNGTSTLNVTNGASTALLTGAITCTNTIPGAAGTQSGTTTIASLDGIKFTFVADGTSKQATWSVFGTR